MRGSTGLIVALTLLVGACVTTKSSYTVMPQRGQTAAQQASDVNACEDQAARQAGTTKETAKGAGVGAAAGALGGAAAGAAIGAATDGNVGKSAAIGAGVGGAGGAAAGGTYKYSKSNEAYNAALRTCLTERGYSVR